MRRALNFGILVLSTMAGMQLAHASACSTSPPSNNLIAGATGSLTATPSDTYEPCTVNTLTFQNFSYDLDAGSFTTAPTPEVNLITANTVGATTNFGFNPNLASGSDLELEFQVSGGISTVSLAVPGLAGTGFVNETICTVFFNPGVATCPSADELGVLNVTATSITVAKGTGCTDPSCGTSISNNTGYLTFGDQPEIWVFKDINSGTAPYSEVVQDFETPEPMTLSLMGVGLLGLGLAGRRLRRK